MGFPSMGDSIVRVLGEPLQVRVGEILQPINLAFLDAGQTISLGGAPIERPNPTFFGNATEWGAAGAKHGDVIIRGGVEYTVVDVGKADEAGLVEITGREYTP